MAVKPVGEFGISPQELKDAAERDKKRLSDIILSKGGALPFLKQCTPLIQKRAPEHISTEQLLQESSAFYRYGEQRLRLCRSCKGSDVLCVKQRGSSFGPGQVPSFDRDGRPVTVSCGDRWERYCMADRLRRTGVPKGLVGLRLIDSDPQSLFELAPAVRLRQSTESRFIHCQTPAVCTRLAVGTLHHILSTVPEYRKLRYISVRKSVQKIREYWDLRRRTSEAEPPWEHASDADIVLIEGLNTNLHNAILQEVDAFICSRCDSELPTIVIGHRDLLSSFDTSREYLRTA